MILVTGGAGYIGSHTVHQLVERGEKVVVLDNLSRGHRWAVPSEVPLEVGSTGDADFLDSVFKKYPIRAVVHFAALLDVEESTRLPDKYYENNVVGSMTLVQACRRAKVKEFIFSSTCAVYGNPDKNPVSESHSVSPVSTYGKSKAAFEWYLQDLEAAGQLGMKTVILRYFNVAGANPTGKNGQQLERSVQLISAACEAAIGKRKSLNIYGSDYPTKDGTTIRDYIHVDDLAAIHVLAYDYLARGGKSEIFNCGYGKGYSVREVVAAVKKVSGVNFTTVEQPRRAGDSVAIYADTDKVKRLLNWVPKYDDLETICRTAWVWETDGKKNILGKA